MNIEFVNPPSLSLLGTIAALVRCETGEPHVSIFPEVPILFAVLPIGLTLTAGPRRCVLSLEVSSESDAASLPLNGLHLCGRPGDAHVTPARPIHFLKRAAKIALLAASGRAPPLLRKLRGRHAVAVLCLDTIEQRLDQIDG